ncbi:MAG: DUF4342 domain-containing protein [Chloroflexota bacterium]|nr:DUF4342 domain-containing protein [Chloroflexota bacterium]
MGYLGSVGSVTQGNHTAVAAGGLVMAVVPVQAALGAMAPLLAHMRVEIVRTGEEGDQAQARLETDGSEQPPDSIT